MCSNEDPMQPKINKLINKNKLIKKIKLKRKVLREAKMEKFPQLEVKQNNKQINP